MKPAKFLSERELRSIIAADIPPQYRAMAAAYWGSIQEFLRRRHLVAVQVDATTYESVQNDAR